jgi:iron complex outermembrane receptor protein
VLYSVSGSKGKGVEFELAVRPITGLQLQLTGDWQKSEYRDNPTINGNAVQRQPKLQYRFSPSYRIPVGDGNSLKIYGTYSHIGERWADQANQQYLPSYRTSTLGVLARWATSSKCASAAPTSTTSLGLTEGNSRLTGASTGPINARPLFGRTWEASLLYRFFA